MCVSFEVTEVYDAIYPPYIMFPRENKRIELSSNLFAARAYNDEALLAFTPTTLHSFGLIHSGNHCLNCVDITAIFVLVSIYKCH